MEPATIMEEVVNCSFFLARRKLFVDRKFYGNIREQNITERLFLMIYVRKM